MLLTTSDWMRETWTPISRWTPEHSMHTMTPKLVDNHVASVVIEEYINVKHWLSKQLDGTFKYGFFGLRAAFFLFPSFRHGKWKAKTITTRRRWEE